MAMKCLKSQLVEECVYCFVIACVYIPDINAISTAVHLVEREKAKFVERPFY